MEKRLTTKPELSWFIHNLSLGAAEASDQLASEFPSWINPDAGCEAQWAAATHRHRSVNLKDTSAGWCLHQDQNSTALLCALCIKICTENEMMSQWLRGVKDRRQHLILTWQGGCLPPHRTQSCSSIARVIKEGWGSRGNLCVCWG